MVSIATKDLKRVKRLYVTDRRSMSEIARKLKVSIDAVVYFMRKHNLARRDARAANLVWFEHQKPTFKQRHRLDFKAQELQAIGVALYWAEGYKSDKSAMIDFANSDTRMIGIFLAFLRSSFKLKESKFRVLLYCHPNQDIRILVRHWSKITRIPTKQFTKPYIRPFNNQEKKTTRRMPYGLIHIRYHDKKLLLAIKDLIRYYQGKFAQVDP